MAVSSTKTTRTNWASEAHVQVSESVLLYRHNTPARQACRAIGGVVRFKAVEWAAHVDA